MWARAVEGAFSNVTLTPRPEHGVFRQAHTADSRVIEVAARPHRVHLRHPSRALEGMWAVLLQVEGESELQADGVQLSLRQGAGVVLFPNSELNIDLADYCQRIIIIPRALISPPALLRPLHPSDPRMRALQSVAAAPPPSGIAPWVRLALSASVRLRRALEWMEQHPEATPEAVARAQGVSRRGLDGLFAETGLTIAAALWETRLLRARALLAESKLRVLEVALHTGFRTEAHFSRRFRARFGIAPSRARSEVM